MHRILLELPRLGLTFESYDVMLALAVLTGLGLAPYWAWSFEGLDWRRTMPASLVFAVVILLGARLHFVATQWSRFAEHPLTALRLGSGGLHAPGGLIALVLSAPLVLRAFQIPAAKFADICTPTGGTILAIVRVGCFLNGCCFGTLCTWPWCIRFPRQSYVFLLHADQHLVEPTALASASVHPLQLYFLAASLLIAAVGLWLERHKRYDGETALAGLFLFSASSGLLEFLRADYPGRVYWGTLPQLAWVTLGMAVASAAVWGLMEYRHGARSRGGRRTVLVEHHPDERQPPRTENLVRTQWRA